MDILQKCAYNFNLLLGVRYEIIIGRKNNNININLYFDKADFHHLAGLHKLKDLEYVRSGKRENIFDDILSGALTIDDIKKSSFFNEVNKRLEILLTLENIIDDNKTVFRYDPKAVMVFTSIKADFLLENILNENIVYVFLGRKNTQCDEYNCVTLFPKEKVDYALRQPKYTLLKKVKYYPNGTNDVLYNKFNL